MGMHHHGEGQDELLKRFLDQGKRPVKRTFSDGRIGADDDGDLAYLIAADPKRQIVRIEFNKPVSWLGLDRDSAEALRDKLTEKLLELRGIKAQS